MVDKKDDKIWNTKVSCPSNIALIKYWGKKETQIPLTPSISFTLSECKTITSLDIYPKSEANTQISFTLEENENPLFSEKILNYFKSIKNLLPWILDYDYIIHSKNTFPHSAGIASSASSFGALAFALAQYHINLYPKVSNQIHFASFVSELARLGSGSASRSIFPSLSLWGKTIYHTQSSDSHAICINEYHELFETYQDTILIVDSGIKKISSTKGHQLMENHTYRDVRIKNANNRINELLEVLEKGNLDKFCEIVEADALELHALMMTSHPSFILLQPNTLKIAQEIQDFRKKTKIPVCFTIDAGPNIHVLYPKEFSDKVKFFINDTLKPYYFEYICDQIGHGANLI